MTVTARKRSNLSDYYGSIGLNPVGHDIADAARLRAHEAKRRNLLEQHLRLPGLCWRGARVIEFGPGSGENAAFLARAGARLTFVEPLDYLAGELRRKFAELGVSRSIEAVHLDVLESFRSNDRYDIVFAEGFVHFLDDPLAGIRKLSSFVADGGFLVISVVHPGGTFIEFVKRAYLELAASALGRTSPEGRFALARAFFEPEFKKINHSRGFESWAKDCVLNPLYRPKHFVDMPEALAALPAGFILYASWPNYRDADDLVWHKNLVTPEQLRAKAVQGYLSRAPHFIHSIPRPSGRLEAFDPKEGRAFLKALDSCYAVMDRAIESRARAPEPYRKGLALLRRELARTGRSTEALRVVDEALRLFSDASKARDERALVAGWRRRRLLRELWGSPGHYFVFQKTAG